MDARFLSLLRVERVDPGRDEWVLVAELAFSSKVLEQLVIVPTGFKTDFASVPRLPLAFWLFGGVAQEAAVVHDFLYSSGTCSRKLADEVFAEASKACGVPAWRRGPMWLAVRLFGGSRFSASVVQHEKTPTTIENETLIDNATSN